MPRSVFEDDSFRNRTYLAHKDAIEQGLFIAGFHISGTGIAVDPPTDNAVLPAWRDTIMHTIAGSEWTCTSTWETIQILQLSSRNGWTSCAKSLPIRAST